MPTIPEPITWTLRLRGIDSLAPAGPKYGEWVDQTGQEYACLLGIGKLKLPFGEGDTIEVRGKVLHQDLGVIHFELVELVEPLGP